MSWSCGARAAAFNVNHQEGTDLRHGGYWFGQIVLVVQDSGETKKVVPTNTKTTQLKTLDVIPNTFDDQLVKRPQPTAQVTPS